jgi:dihydrofolate synthase/folylpolyglutamate synthase
MHFPTLAEWLSWIGKLHGTEIDLGLERVQEVAARLAFQSPTCPVIIVGGTNGKGSTVAGLAAIYRAAGYRVGAFTSPYVWKYNEQVKINGQEASDADFCAAFARIAAACGETSLTPFEFGTLAAFLIFQQHVLDIWLVEVGLGGRLDAVNILDADVAVVTSISLDHTQWLGTTREAIAREKAGIFRAMKPAVCGDVNPPHTLLDYARELNTPLFCQGQQFHYQETATDWSFQSPQQSYAHLPRSSLMTQNMATVLMAIQLLQERLPIPRQAIEVGLKHVTLTGRIQIIPGAVTEIIDVSHNPDSVARLAQTLAKHPVPGKTWAVFSMLADKDCVASVLAIRDDIDGWYVAPLATPRGASLTQLQTIFVQTEIKTVSFFPAMRAAYQAARAHAQPGDRVVVFGSFHTLAEVYSPSVLEAL